MRVIPEAAGIGGGERVAEALAGLDRRLGQIGHAIHGIGDAQAMPVHHRGLVQLVDHVDREWLAPAQAQHRRRAIGREAHHVGRDGAGQNGMVEP